MDKKRTKNNKEKVSRVKLEMNFIQFIFSIFLFGMVFVLPVFYYETTVVPSTKDSARASDVSENRGEVAGVSTERVSKVGDDLVTGISHAFATRNMLVIAGASTIGLAFLLLGFVLIDNYKKRAI